MHLVDLAWIIFNIYWLFIDKQSIFIIQMSIIIKKSFNYDYIFLVLVSNLYLYTAIISIFQALCEFDDSNRTDLSNIRNSNAKKLK